MICLISFKSGLENFQGIYYLIPLYPPQPLSLSLLSRQL